MKNIIFLRVYTTTKLNITINIIGTSKITDVSFLIN
jgi:hypothetical protein